MAHLLFQLALVLYVIQGIALVHALIAHRKAALGWLVTMYVSLMLLWPVAMVALAVAGFSDTWVDYRARWKSGV